MKRAGLAILWVIVFLVVGLTSIFIHECGHGFGARLDGINVSSGFNRIGGYGKFPSDPDFRPPDEIITGEIGSFGFLGPFSTWALAILGTWLLLSGKGSFFRSSIFGSIAIYNSLLRLIPMTLFFWSALKGKLTLEDEMEWAARSVKGIDFPIEVSAIKEILANNPDIYLRTADIYFWPAISTLISAICLLLSLNYIFKKHRDIFNNLCVRSGFILEQFILFFITYKLANVLDDVIRINW